jgi:hypothetical protein
MMKRSESLVVALATALALLIQPSPATAKEPQPKDLPAEPLRVAVMPLVNRTQETLADQVVNAVLKEQLSEFDEKRATFLLSTDVERILGAHDAYGRAIAVAERWARGSIPDSAAIPGLDTLLHADAVLMVAITDWETKRIAVINAGQSSTTIGLRFQLYDIRTRKSLWKKEVREERLADEYDISSGSTVFDETGTIRSRGTNEPPRPKDVTEDLVKSALRRFPRS